jgi:hypothetical protein
MTTPTLNTDHKPWQKVITAGVDMMPQTVMWLMDREDEVEDAPVEPDEPMN